MDKINKTNSKIQIVNFVNVMKIDKKMDKLDSTKQIDKFLNLKVMILKEMKAKVPRLFWEKIYLLKDLMINC